LFQVLELVYVTILTGTSGLPKRANHSVPLQQRIASDPTPNLTDPEIPLISVEPDAAFTTTSSLALFITPKARPLATAGRVTIVGLVKISSLPLSAAVSVVFVLTACDTPRKGIPELLTVVTPEASGRVIVLFVLVTGLARVTVPVPVALEFSAMLLI
jgi:hypothetical protein